MLHGQDETLLHGLQLGAGSGVGGTYNHCFGVYRKIIDYYKKGEYDLALEQQNLAQEFINVLIRFGGNVVAGKRMMKFIGLDCGPNRLPVKSLSDHDEREMLEWLEKIGFNDFCNR
jgi:N-acetylneuraminate lyase